MKKTLKICVSLILCFAIIFAATSCDFIGVIKDHISPDNNVTDNSDGKDDNKKEHSHSNIVPEGYTAGFGGDPHMHQTYGFYWLETYEEVLEAVELLNSHGSDISLSIGFNCDGEPYDIKWLFMYERRYAEKLEEGKNYFDRKIDGHFRCYIFPKDVSIAVLNYSILNLYDASLVYTRKSNPNLKIEDPSLLYFSWYGKQDGDEAPWNDTCQYYVYYADERVCEIEYLPLSKDDMQILLNSLVFVGG